MTIRRLGQDSVKMQQMNKIDSCVAKIDMPINMC